MCYLPAYGKEVSSHSFQVLTNPAGANLQWVWCDGEQIPTGALIGGLEKDGTILYIGRARHSNGSMAIGKFSMMTKQFYYPFGSEEHTLKKFEILVATNVTPN